MNLTQFEIVVQIRDIAEARRFYREVLGCLEGHSDTQRLEFTLYGHPIVCCLDPQLGKQGRVSTDYRLMDGKYRPVSRCGVVLETKEWCALLGRLKQHKAKFRVEPLYIARVPREPTTLSLLDPSGNALEFRSLHNTVEQLSLRERLKSLGKRVARW
jgi:extradiol dioxygenase family protein